MPRARNAARPKHVTVEELRDYLTEVEGKTATQRIMVGINHKEGIPQTKLADWYNVSRTTVHNWLNRLERLDEEPLEEVIYDKERPGRPSKLDSDERDRLAAALQASPNAVGYDASTWTPRLVRTYIAETFDVEYSLSYVRELMHESGVSWRTTRMTESEDVDRTGRRSTEDGSEDTHSEDTNSGDDSAPHRVHGCRS